MHLPANALATGVQSYVTNNNSSNHNNNNSENHNNNNNNNNSTDWNSVSETKGGMLEPPTTGGSESPIIEYQELWWTERLVIDAQNEFPGELGMLSKINL